MNEEQRQAPAIKDDAEDLKFKQLQDDDFIKITAPYYNQLKEQGEMRDNDTVNDAQLKTAQTPVLNAANIVVKLKLKQEQYRAEWKYKDTLRADKWKRKDRVREQKRKRRELVKARKVERKAARTAEREQRKAANAAKRTPK